MGIKGWGLMAAQIIPANSFVIEYIGALPPKHLYGIGTHSAVLHDCNSKAAWVQLQVKWCLQSRLPNEQKDMKPRNSPTRTS